MYYLPEIKKIMGLINEKDKETEATEVYQKCRFTQIAIARLAVKYAIENILNVKDEMFAIWKLSNKMDDQQEHEVRKLDEERELKSIEAFNNNTNYSNDEYWDELLDAILEVIDLENSQVQEFKDKMKHEIVSKYEAFTNQVTYESEVFKLYINNISNLNSDKKIIEKLNELYESIISYRKISNNIYSVNVEEDFKDYFVETKFYKDAIVALERDPVVILLGMPGAGKTYTSKRICLDYEDNGYSVFYSDEGNIGKVKEYIQTCEKDKLLVVLNDFLGQFYVELNMSETGEFVQLISYIKTRKNIKLLINSRNTIYNEALKSRKFEHAVDNICELRADELSFKEKAWILYNHLKKGYKNGIISKEQCQAVIENRKCTEIVLNEKFSPRIIEYVTTNRKVLNILPQEYVAFINKKLEFPETIWQEEIEKLDKYDRIFINTLFSLTKTYVSKDMFKKCFNYRIKNDGDIKDTTINNFDSSLHRLIESMVQVTVSGGKEKIGVLNPSINAYLHENLFNNENEVEEIIKSALYLDQLERFESLRCSKYQIIELMNSGKYKNLKTIQRQLFENIPVEFTPPEYIYTLKLLLFVLDESDLQKINVQKIDIQNFVLDLFVNKTNSIESNARLYSANEFSDIFCKLFSITGMVDYDFTEIVANETYLQIILKSVARRNDFWENLTNIQERYFLGSEDKFYDLESVQLL